jgi:hypothetical protein
MKYTQITFEREELLWLRAEAKRRKLTWKELLNALLALHCRPGGLPIPEFYSKRKERKKITVSDIINDIIRVERLAQSWRNDGRIAVS